MKRLKVSLELTSNGSILEKTDGTTEAYIYDSESKQGLVYLLYALMDELEMNQKYNRENIEIRVVHGRGYEHKNKKEAAKCPICKSNGNEQHFVG